MLGLLGPNGAGKTTTMRTIFGLVRPDGGSVTWDGVSIDKRIRRRFGYMPEERGLYPRLGVRWQLVYLARIHGLGRVEAAEAADRWLELFTLTDRADAAVRELSHGNQQRVQLIAALIHEPDLVVLDEPFVGLDPIGAASMAEVLARLTAEGKAVVFSSHQLDVVEDLCRDVVIVDRGRVVLSGAVRDLRASSPIRYLEIVGGDGRSIEALPQAVVVERGDQTVRARVPADIDLERVGGLLAGRGIVQFSFEPPPLSEVFRKAVER